MTRFLAICVFMALASTGVPAGDTSVGSQSAKVSPPGRWTAMEVRAMVMSKAYEWDHGCKLIFVAGKPYDLRSDGRSSRWAFRCVGSDGAHIASFSVDMAHPMAVRVTKNVSSPAGCQDVVNEAKWTIDSPRAYASARLAGLDAWLAKHPGFSPTYSGNRLELASSKADGPFWLISCAAKATPKSRRYDRITIIVSAMDGHVISCSTCPKQF